MRNKVLGIGLAGLLALGGLAYLQTSFQGATPQPTVQVPEEAEKVVALAIADLAVRLGVPEAEILVVSVDAVEWPDTSLGHPQPGYAYAQVITPGFRIILEAKGQIYEYHSDYERVVFIAE
ncbi:MAG: hypothetical protein HYX86_00805 [Chloroflexi bacterium]|nr:hypothetical protein [Chloroflexota bacterium]